MVAVAPQDSPLLRRARAILGDYRFAADPVDALCATGASYREHAEGHLERLFRAVDSDDDRFADAVEAFVEMTVDVMRMQERYYRTGQFNAGPDAVSDGLYEDDDLMGRRYLFGLYLAQIFWPNHLEKVRFFEYEFLPLAADGMRVLEVGTGPGTYGLSIGRAAACEELLLNDISPLSVDAARRFGEVDPVRRPGTLHFSTADFLDFDAEATEPFHLVVFSEVLEHLRDPARGLEQLRHLLEPGASVFFTTATNAAFYDHTIVFESVEMIESLLREHGFEVSSSRSILAAKGPENRDVVDYVAVIRAAGSR
jgi:2-polyprenyl-3-methyl-5-hydroxy-6-metoxy-1,4-benzoquinol methylase